MAKKRPFVFIGSSAEGLPVAKAIQANLDHSCECQIWSQGLFGLNEGTLETLVNSLEKFDFAIFAVTPDDITRSRGTEIASARDNVIFELGLFIGGLGRNRVFFVIDREAKAKLPSDLAGITPATYIKPTAGNYQSALGTACTAIEERVEEVRAKQSHYNLSFAVSPSWYRDSTKVEIVVTNNDKRPLPSFVGTLTNSDSFGIIANRTTSGELLPTQFNPLYIPVISNVTDKPVLLQRSFGKLRNHVGYSDEPIPTEVDPDKWVWKIKLENSNTVLYESVNIGRALAAAISRAIELMSVEDVEEAYWEAIPEK